MSYDEGHGELMSLIRDAHDADQQSPMSEFPTADQFRGLVVLALRNLAGRVDTLERDLATAQETIGRLEGK